MQRQGGDSKSNFDSDWTGQMPASNFMVHPSSPSRIGQFVCNTLYDQISQRWLSCLALTTTAELLIEPWRHSAKLPHRNSSLVKISVVEQNRAHGSFPKTEEKNWGLNHKKLPNPADKLLVITKLTRPRRKIVWDIPYYSLFLWVVLIAWVDPSETSSRRPKKHLPRRQPCHLRNPSHEC